MSSDVAEECAVQPALTRHSVAIHRTDDLTYFRLQRVLDAMGLHAERITRRSIQGATHDPPTLAIVLAASPADWNTIAALASGIDTIVLAANPSESGARRALELGAIGYLPLHLGDATLRNALGAILGGEAGFSRIVLGQWVRSQSHHLRTIRAPTLTRRQRQILERIARGESDKQIAHHLGIATATVQKHVQLLLRRLQVPNRAGAVRYARIARADELT